MQSSKTKPTSLRARFCRLLCLLFGALFLLGVTCEAPEVLKSEFHPEYPCTGETSILSWETQNIDKIEIRDAQNVLRRTITSSSGSWETPELSADILPFKARGYVGDEWDEYSLGHLLLLSDNPVWVSYESNDFSAPSLEFGPPIYVYEEEQVDGTVIRVEYETVYRTVTEYIWRIPHTDFSTRARVTKVENKNDEDFYIRAGGSLAEVLVGANAVLDIQSPFFPGVDWHARRINPQPVAVGRHRVGTGKEGIEIYSTPAKRELKFFVRCLQE